MAKKKDSGYTRRKTAYELMGERVPRFNRGVDPIDDALLEEERDLSREHKRLRLEAMIEKRRREVEKMREGIVDGGSLPSNTDFLNMAKFMSELNPEEAQRVRSAYAFFKTAEKGSGAGMNMLLPLIGYAKENPGASQNQMVQYLTLMNNQLVKGMELMKAANPPKQGEPMTYMVKGMELMKNVNPQKQDNPLEFLKLMKELVIEGVRNPVLQAIREAQPTPGVFEQILTKPDLWNRAKEIGMFGSSNVASSQIDLEIEKLRGERQMTVTKMELEMHRDDLTRQSEDRRTDTLIKIFGPMAASFVGPASQKMQEMGQQAAARNPTMGMQPGSINPAVKPSSPGNSAVIKCSCGYQGVEAFQGATPASFNCPQCGQILLVGDSYSAGKPEETDTGTRS